MGLKKITVLGDIMCEPRLLKAAKRRDGQYDFSEVFRPVRALLGESDYVIGNLETPLAGEAAGYVHGLFSFNAPDSFARAARDAGIHMLLTANNHCLDRGIPGLKRTVEALEELGINHTGTFASPQERGNAWFQLGGVRFAVLSYTYGTNYSDNRMMLSEEQRAMVNLLRPQNEPYFRAQPQKRSLGQKLIRKGLSLFPLEKRFYLRKWLGLPINEAHPDNNLNLETLGPYLQTLYEDIETAKRSADVVLFCPHIGGQFNQTPGEFSQYVLSKAAERGVDAILASHAHVVQRAERKGRVPCFYSLGNFSMSPNSIYLLREGLPEYGLAAHLYFDGAELVKTGFSVLRIVEKDCLTVYPIDVYYDLCDEQEKARVWMDVRQICSTVTGQDWPAAAIQREYEL